MLTDGEATIEEYGVNIKRLEKQRDEELGGRLTELEETLKEKEKENMKAESNLKAVKDNKKQEEKKMTQIQKGMNTVRSVSISTFVHLKSLTCVFFGGGDKILIKAKDVVHFNIQTSSECFE